MSISQKEHRKGAASLPGRMNRADAGRADEFTFTERGLSEEPGDVS
jgi:hypothetical protein